MLLGSASVKMRSQRKSSLLELTETVSENILLSPFFALQFIGQRKSINPPHLLNHQSTEPLLRKLGKAVLDDIPTRPI